jgi:hypothetical protein
VAKDLPLFIKKGKSLDKTKVHKGNKRKEAKGLLSRYYKAQTFRTRDNPKLHFRFDDVEEGGSWCGLVVENSSISLLPNGPTNKHG